MVNAYVQETVGFHTASHVCSQLVGNISTDCNSNKKYYYFLRMMGRRPSHIALEVGLQCCPNAVLIGEEIWEEQKTLSMIVNELSDMICARALKGKNYGVIFDIRLRIIAIILMACFMSYKSNFISCDTNLFNNSFFSNFI